MLDVVKFWIDLGADGLRVDAPPYLFEREGTNCENLPETHAYLKRMRKFVEEYSPDTLLLSEANQWPACALICLISSAEGFLACAVNFTRLCA